MPERTLLANTSLYRGLVSKSCNLSIPYDILTVDHQTLFIKSMQIQTLLIKIYICILSIPVSCKSTDFLQNSLSPQLYPLAPRSIQPYSKCQ